MEIAAPPADMADDARWLAQALDPSTGLVRLVEMDGAAYRAASFLDDRMLQQPQSVSYCRWDDLLGAVDERDRQDARWIFHIGHVGSTLVARLLGDLPNVLAIREPRLLRDLVALPPEVLASAAIAVSRLLSRTFALDQLALVKATSFVSEIAPSLCPPGQRALFLFASPHNYIRSILAGENSRKELAALVTIRAQRMARRVTVSMPAGASDAHLAAAAWACEMTSLEASADRMSDRSILWADFDTMLVDMAASLDRVTGFFGLPAKPGIIDAIATGPLMQRYSKALEYEYSPALRRDLLDDAGRHYRDEIEAAVAMLHKAASGAPLLARALERVATET